ncbi:5'/3'-nucleotidase SurE [Parahaliea mediterranea]|uniref:5'-nucleotidase n=1 Tax=Parahaliea mediterranea TaxID=651086 RepID=A0A939DI08_9GAMM|nr:5'/3'-nucleotidase SurE [Parahaliea mediterranea]MBN7798474.1 5'/3'-nucleotidase SurE [Parahaliea mediterranea]
MLRKTLTPLRLGLAATALGITLPAWSLNILVTNDDSCTAEGINVLMDALEAAGHTVTMYAPAGEQSGRGGAISTNIGANFGISNVGFHGPTSADNRYCVRIPAENPAEGAEDEEITISASPKDSALVGLALMADNPPDLVVSGMNDGQNIGKGAYSSGTVGAAVAAVEKGYPAIAVSHNRFTAEDGMSFAALANFVVDVIAELEAGRTDGAPLLPPGTGLNINNPVGPPRGIAHTTLGQLDLKFGPNTNGEGGAAVLFEGILSLGELVGEAQAEALAANPDATVEDFANAGLDTNDEASMSVAGYITITTLDGDLTAGLRKRELMALKLRELGAGGE